MNWDEGIGWPKMGGGGAGKKPKPRPPAEPVELEPESPASAPEEAAAPPQPEARLSNPKWSRDKACFDEKAEATVDGDLPPEISHLTKVHFTLFAKLPDGATERIDGKDGHLKDGKAKVEFDLWTPKYRNKAGQAPKKAEYYFTAKHRDGEELKSAALPVSNKLVARGLNARDMKRGVRGEDVFAWQKFLKHVRDQPEFASAIPDIRVDGVFGIESHKATCGFQSQVGLEAEGAVGPDTREEAEILGALFVVVPNPGKTEATPQAVRQGKIPVFPPPPPALPAEPPPGNLGSTRDESWRRLRAEGWGPQFKARLDMMKSHLQSVTDGTGEFIYDEYKVEVERMPPGVEPEAFLSYLATDLNRAVRNAAFDKVNVFIRRQKGKPEVGEIVDIDIAGPEDGAVILGEMGQTYFIYQTIFCPTLEAHPENGSREFGFEIEGTKVIFYTRGVSRPGLYLIGLVGGIPQMSGWTALMKGISDRIDKFGGRTIPNSFSTVKEKREN